jgi:hypothetical protein
MCVRALVAAQDHPIAVRVDPGKGECMFSEMSGWLWFVIDVGFVAVLGAALAYGIMHARRLSARKRQQRDAATRNLYQRQQ